MKQKFESICNDIGLLDNETGKKYIYFNEEFVEFLNRLWKDRVHFEHEYYLEKGTGEYYKGLFDEKCKECEVLEGRVNWFIECIERMGYKVVKE